LEVAKQKSELSSRFKAKTKDFSTYNTTPSFCLGIPTSRHSHRHYYLHLHNRVEWQRSAIDDPCTLSRFYQTSKSVGVSACERRR